jgi:hypothetical protein
MGPCVVDMSVTSSHHETRLAKAEIIVDLENPRWTDGPKAGRGTMDSGRDLD